MSSKTLKLAACKICLKQWTYRLFLGHCTSVSDVMVLSLSCVHRKCDIIAADITLKTLDRPLRFSVGVCYNIKMLFSSNKSGILTVHQGWIQWPHSLTRNDYTPRQGVTKHLYRYRIAAWYRCVYLRAGRWAGGRMDMALVRSVGLAVGNGIAPTRRAVPIGRLEIFGNLIQ